MASIVTDALSNVMSIRANPVSAIESASNGFKVSGALFSAITGALDKKELEHQARIDAQQKIINNLEMTKVDMANQRELKALSHKYSVELSNLGYSHSQGLEATRFSHSIALKDIDQSNRIELKGIDQTNKLKYLDAKNTDKLEYLNKKQSYNAKSKKNNNSSTISVITSLPITK